MEPPDVLRKLKEEGQKLEGKKRQVAKYIIDNYREMAFSTLEEIAEDAATSKATVLRLAQELGFDGYQEMQAQIQDLLKNELTTIDLYSSYNHKKIEEESILDRSFINDLQVIQQTLERIDRKKFDKITTTIVSADQVVSMAIGKVSCFANLFTWMLEPMLNNVDKITTSSYLAYRKLATMSENSLLIVFLLARYPQETVSLTKTARKLNIPTITITDSNLSPVEDYSNITITTSMKRVTWIDCYSGILSIIQAIATDVSVKTREETLSKLKRVEKVYKENDVFF